MEYCLGFFDTHSYILYTIGNGLTYTLLLSFFITILSFLFGFLFAVLQIEKFDKSFLRYCIKFLCYMLRGIPFYIQLLISYFMIPYWLDISVSPVFIGVISLGFCSAAYTSQTFVTIINEIIKKQWDIARGLGYKPKQIIQYIILPQAIKISLPSLIAEADQILKSTSILSSIGIIELTRAGMNIVSKNMNPGEIYPLIGIVYLGISSILLIIQYYIKKKFKYL
jgi:polar amino acid transport system permease protein